MAAGEALDPGVLAAWHDATGLWIRDGYGQTETGQLTGMPLGEPARPGSMGRPLPGISLAVVDGELVLDPATDPTFFLRYLDGEPAAGPWRTGDRVHAGEDGFLYFEGRADDVIVSAGYRIGPFEVESVLAAHPAVADAAVVAAPDDGARQRGPRGRRAPRRACAVGVARARAAGPRQGADGALQVPARGRLRRRAAADAERQGPARGAARRGLTAPSVVVALRA